MPRGHPPAPPPPDPLGVRAPRQATAPPRTWGVGFRGPRRVRPSGLLLARLRIRREDGQAAVELVGLLPCIAALLLVLWQAALAGHAAWAATTAARAAARAAAVGADARRAARDHLPSRLERQLRVETAGDGDVRVAIRIPTLPGIPSLGYARAGAHFEPQ